MIGMLFFELLEIGPELVLAPPAKLSLSAFSRRRNGPYAVCCGPRLLPGPSRTRCRVPLVHPCRPVWRLRNFRWSTSTGRMRRIGSTMRGTGRWGRARAVTKRAERAFEHAGLPKTPAVSHQARALSQLLSKVIGALHFAARRRYRERHG